MDRSPQVRYCRSPDGTSIAYACAGKGPALLESAYCLHSLEHGSTNALWRAWVAELSRNRTYVRYDARGFGLSQRDPEKISFQAMVDDLAAVADAAGLERFALIGHSSAGAVAVAYAARHPERVVRLMLCSSYAVSRTRQEPHARDENRLYQQLAQVGWESRDPAFRHLFQEQFTPDAPDAVHKAHEELQLLMPTENVLRTMRMTEQIDVTDLAPKVSCPTLVVQSRGDLRHTLQEASFLSRLIPDSRLVVLPTRNRILWEGEPAWAQFAEEVRAFLPSAPEKPGSFPGLTARERELVELLARGLDNHQIAARLEVSEKTVRNMVSIVFDKLEVESRAQAIVRAREAGYGIDSHA